ncbi:WD40 repeat-like protein, partial [Sistotremastrum niveocremeum HHB9708]
LDKLDKFVKLVDNISEVHPYAKVAWSVISAAYKKQRDGAIAHLIDVMDDTYAFVIESKELFQVESQRKLLENLANQTTECGHFIVNYAKNKTFGGRTLTNILGEADGVIKSFESSFSDLKAAIQLRGSVQTQIVVFQTIKLTRDIAIDINLNDMQYVGDASFLPEKACFPGTRKEIIETITQWVVQPDQAEGASLFWLKGFAGSGKSAVAHTIAHRFHSGKRLGSSYIFDESHATERRADTVFSKISRDLAAISDGWKDSLGKIIKNSPDLRHTSSVRRQFEELILAPAKDVVFIGPILIVIDALDECGGTPDARRELLRILATRLSELPSNFCILLTSRPQKEFEDAFVHCPYITPLDIQAASDSSVDKDLAVYYEARLGDLAELDDAWPDKSWLSELIKRSEGLFQWAFTACEYILEPGWSPDEQLHSLLFSTELSGLDSLYKTILHNIFVFAPNDGRIARFRSILGRILCARTPLNVTDLIALHGPDESPSMLKSIVQRMGPVLSGVSTDYAPVQALHTSFRDFLFSQERSETYHIDPLETERSLAKACLTVLNKELTFNISNMQTSHGFDPLVEDIVVPPHLTYSARFWSDHLSTLSYSEEFVPLLHTFTQQQFLHWLELLGRYDEMYRARKAMRALRKWVLVSFALFDFGTDAEKFINTLTDTVSSNPPHLYISALPFAPTASLVAKYFNPQFENTLTLQAGKQQTYPPLVETLGTRTIAESLGAGDWDLYAVGFSGDGCIIASAWEDGRVGVWDARSGSLLGQFKGDSSSPTELIDFCSDGSQILTGSTDGTISIWDASTAVITNGGSEEFQVFSITITPDGRNVATGASDGTIRTYDLESGNEILPPQDLSNFGHVQEWKYSPDMKRLAILLASNEVRLWDAENWTPLGNPMTGHTDMISCLSFSSDGQRLATGSNDHVLCIWNTTTYQMVTKTVGGHTRPIWGAQFFIDRTRVASCSTDGKICVWETESGRSIGDPLDFHRAAVYALAISPNQSCAASGSADGLIHIWDTTTLSCEGQPTMNHDAHIVWSVAFSSDGERLLSSGNDHTIRIWDTRTGQLIGIPMEDHSGPVS